MVYLYARHENVSQISDFTTCRLFWDSFQEKIFKVFIKLKIVL